MSWFDDISRTLKDEQEKTKPIGNYLTENPSDDLNGLMPSRSSLTAGQAGSNQMAEAMKIADEERARRQANPLPEVSSKQAELDQALKDYRAGIETGLRPAAETGDRRDAMLKKDLLDRIETGLAIRKDGLPGGMDIDRALEALRTGSRTNRLQYATTATAENGTLASILGAPNRTPPTSRSPDGEAYNLSGVIRDLGLDATSGKMRQKALDVDQILHPEKYQERADSITLPDGRTVQGTRNPKNGGFQRIPDERELYYSTPNGVLDVRSGKFVPGSEPKGVPAERYSALALKHGVDDFDPSDPNDVELLKSLRFERAKNPGGFTDKVSDALFESRMKLYKDSYDTAISPDDYYQKNYDPQTGQRLAGSAVNPAMEARLKELNGRYEKYGQEKPFNFGENLPAGPSRALLSQGLPSGARAAAPAQPAPAQPAPAPMTREEKIAALKARKG